MYSRATAEHKLIRAPTTFLIFMRKIVSLPSVHLFFKSHFSVFS